MKKTYLLILTLLPSIAFSQLEYEILDIDARDLVYDSNTDRIYASIRGSSASNANTLGVINPNNNTLESTIFIGNNPSVMAISDDGQFIYIGFVGWPTIRKFEIATQTLGLEFELNSSSETPLYARDIEVMPGQSNTIAVSRTRYGGSPHAGVAIYDDGVMRPNTTPDSGPGSDVIEFDSHNSLIGYSLYSNDHGIRRMSVDNSGISVLPGVTYDLMSGSFNDFTYHNNRMYTNSGQIIDTTGDFYEIGQLIDFDMNAINSPSIYDTSTDLICGTNSFSWGGIEFTRYNPNTLVYEDGFWRLFPLDTRVTRLITCGPGCYAFITVTVYYDDPADGKLVIVRDTSLSLNEFSYENKLSFYPNPTIDYLSIKNGQNIEKVLVYDVSGKLVSKFINKFENLYLGDLASGIYFVKIIDKSYRSTIKKLIKN